MLDDELVEEVLLVDEEEPADDEDVEWLVSALEEPLEELEELDIGALQAAKEERQRREKATFFAFFIVI